MACTSLLWIQYPIGSYVYLIKKVEFSALYGLVFVCVGKAYSSFGHCHTPYSLQHYPLIPLSISSLSLSNDTHGFYFYRVPYVQYHTNY